MAIKFFPGYWFTNILAFSYFSGVAKLSSNLLWTPRMQVTFFFVNLIINRAWFLDIYLNNYLHILSPQYKTESTKMKFLSLKLFFVFWTPRMQVAPRSINATVWLMVVIFLKTVALGLNIGLSLTNRYLISSSLTNFCTSLG